MADEAYWTYRASEPTPSLADALRRGAVYHGTTEADWVKLSPGMRREIVRSASIRPGDLFDPSK